MELTLNGRKHIFPKSSSDDIDKVSGRREWALFVSDSSGTRLCHVEFCTVEEYVYVASNRARNERLSRGIKSDEELHRKFSHSMFWLRWSSEHNMCVIELGKDWTRESRKIAISSDRLEQVNRNGLWQCPLTAQTNTEKVKFPSFIWTTQSTLSSWHNYLHSILTSQLSHLTLTRLSNNVEPNRIEISIKLSTNPSLRWTSHIDDTV